jgi:alkanesulfonate monooxygenase SsuD/methylene tetrahydromethanopterin reductase-like flavin-dependent oxidoreductase (luciferase family)
LRAELAAAGRDDSDCPNAIATMWTYVTDDAGEADRILSEVLAPIVRRPIADLREQVLVGSPEMCAERLRAYSTQGAQRVFLWPVGDEVEQLALFWERVRPLV